MSAVWRQACCRLNVLWLGQETSGYITMVRVTKAKQRTYITGIWGPEGKRQLAVEISEKMSAKHRELAEQIAERLREGKFTKADALRMRVELLG